MAPVPAPLPTPVLSEQVLSQASLIFPVHKWKNMSGEATAQGLPVNMCYACEEFSHLQGKVWCFCIYSEGCSDVSVYIEVLLT